MGCLSRTGTLGARIRSHIPGLLRMHGKQMSMGSTISPGALRPGGLCTLVGSYSEVWIMATKQQIKMRDETVAQLYQHAHQYGVPSGDHNIEVDVDWLHRQETTLHRYAE